MGVGRCPKEFIKGETPRAGGREAMRWGLGPVFAYEWVAGARRWQVYAARSVVASGLLIAMWAIWWSRPEARATPTPRAQAEIGELYFYALIGVEMALVLLAAPAATAGTICLDRSRGTLAHLLTTDLSDPEIVLGKLAARLVPVFGLVAGSWPVIALASLLGGIDPTALVLALAVVAAVAVLGCAMALAVSVWAKKPHEVFMATYTFWLLVLLAYPICQVLARGGRLPAAPRWVLLADPFYLAFAPYIEPGVTSPAEYAGFFAATLGASLALAALAVWRMRPATVRDASRPAARRDALDRLGTLGRAIRRLPGPSLDGNPVLWREWHRNRPSRVMAWAVVIFGVTTGLAIAWEAIDMMVHGIAVVGPSAGGFGYIFQVILGLLLLGAVAPMSLSEERQRGSLDVLLATPLSTRRIVVGKWWGTFRLVPLLALCPALMILGMATADLGPWMARMPAATRDHYNHLTLAERLYGVGLFIVTILAHGAATTSVGLALATWGKRQGRAIALSVGLVVLVAIAWPILVYAIFRSPTSLTSWAAHLATLSPFYIAVTLPDMLTFRPDNARELLRWGSYWGLAVALFALVLLELTVRTFDACFERMPEGRARPEARREPAEPMAEPVLAGP
jgi:ABC-type transport system involved in multi-copper enzyme maturation permease subunit